MKWGRRKCREKAAREPTILSVQLRRLSFDSCTPEFLSLFSSPPPHCAHPAAWSLLRLYRPPGRGAPCAVPLTCAPQRIQEHSATHSGGVGKYLACDGMPPVCRSAPPRIWQLRPMLQAPIHPKCSLARCTKLLETLGQGKLTYSAPIQFITVWKSPSGGSYVGCPSSGHGLTLT